MNAPAPRPVYLVTAGPLSGALREAFPRASLVGTAEALSPLESREPGLVVLDRDGLPAAAVLALAEEAAASDGAWTLALARSGGQGLQVRPLSLGWPTPPAELARWAESGGSEGAVLELRAALDAVARARHDINNPLTSGMAEVQLLLMDAPPEGELREALETIQAQFRRIRDMVAGLRTLRPPD